MVKISTLLICMGLVVLVNLYPSQMLAQSCNTPLRLLEQSNCDRNWNNYKEGYQDCVMNAAKWFWKEYACSWNSVEKLNKACEGCAKTYKKTNMSSSTKTSKEIKSVDAVLLKGTAKGCPTSHPLKCGNSGYCCPSGYPWLCLSQKKCYQSEEAVQLKCDGLILECK